MRNLSFKNGIGANPICHIANVPFIYILVNYCPGLMQRISLCCLFMVVFNLRAQQNADLQKLIPKRFIDKVEIFAGTNFCFNHGNKFIENYSSPNFNNQREFKIGYSLGIGVYHPISKRFDINLKLSWDQKGAKSKFVTACTDPGYHNLVQTVESKYSYNYITLSLIPRIFLSKNGRFVLLLGGYYSIIKGVNAHVLWASHSDTYNISNDQSFHGRQVYDIDNNGGITGSSTSIGLSSFENDYGAIIGLGYFIPLKKTGRITIQLTENFGFANINKQVFLHQVKIIQRKITLLVS